MYNNFMSEYFYNISFDELFFKKTTWEYCKNI